MAAAQSPSGTSLVISAGCPAAPYGARSSAPGSGKTVALTFDDGPGASTASILSILASYNITATFFNLGQNMAARSALVRQEASSGHLLGNHTWDHPDMTKLSASAQGSEMDRATVGQQELTGTLPCVFRPPGGPYNATTLSLAQQRGMAVWTWSADTEDWKANGSSSAYWVNRIISLAEQGGASQHPVVLMHNQPAGNPATVLALPVIIRYFLDRGYTFVDLLGRGGTGWSTRQVSQASAQAGGVIDVFWKAMDTDVKHNWFVSGWNGPRWMGPNAVAGEPSATTSSPGVVDMFWLGTNDRLWHQWYTPSCGWSGQQQMAAGAMAGRAAAVAQADGSVDVFWRGADGHLWHMGYRPGHGWSGAQGLGGDLTSDPAPAATSPGTVDVFWRGADGHLWHAFSIRGGSWSAPASLGMGTLGGPPASTGQASGAVDVFWKGTDGHLWRAGYAPGNGWSGPTGLGGVLASDPAPAASSPGTVDVFFKGGNGSLWHVFRVSGGSWSAPASLGMGVLGSRPWTASRPGGAIDVFWRGSADGHLWHAAYRPGSGWTGPASLGGDLYPVS